ncbi:DUF5686 and carboxypeptidase regulatory-like domain-containing protein [bacterium]|nr:DUF5686 and carboxypeptidase regulatory-like domain-containing protein [bacterium]
MIRHYGNRFCVTTAIFLFALSLAAVSAGQNGAVIHGVVTDSATGETLPVAHLRVEGTRKGTITNTAGFYTIELDSLPTVIHISYIGYKSQTLTITDRSPEEQNIALVPSPIQLQEVVVSAEDPAIGIMREVIRRKQIWRKTLESYRAEAYTRIVIENDTTIVSILESISEVLWDHKKGVRETIGGKRQTKNIKAQNNFASARVITNFYDDDINISGYKIIGPTNPDAFKYYDFKLTGKRKIDDTTVFDISVTPKTILQPTLVGSLSVLDGEFALIRVQLQPGEMILFPPPIDNVRLTFEQQFSNFGQSYWLPVDVKNEGEITIKLPGLAFPPLKYRQLTRFADYDVNVALPDSLFKKVKTEIQVSATASSDSITISAKKTDSSITDESARARSDSLFAAKKEDIIPLTEGENKAYDVIDSTMTFDKAFKPTGWLARMVIDDDKKENKPKKPEGPVRRFISPFRPQVWHNRVDAYHLGLKYGNKIVKDLKYELSGAYKTGPDRWSYGGSLKYNWGDKGNWSAGLGYADCTAPRYQSSNYPMYLSSYQTLFGHTDYFDYFRNKSLSASLERRFVKPQLKVGAGIAIEDHSSLIKETERTIWGSTKHQRPNAAISEGALRSVNLSVEYGGERIPFGIMGQKRVELDIEHSFPDFLSSDFSFTSYRITVDWRINTFLRRRMLPNTLDIRLIGGTSTGNLPVQRFGIIDGSMGSLSPFGVFRALRNHPLEGEQYCAFFMEHNFRTVPFELVGLKRLAKKGTGIILHGAAGRTWIPEKRLSGLGYEPFYLDRFHSEIGLSVNALFGYFRLDVTKRLDRHGVFWGIGVVRML